MRMTASNGGRSTHYHAWPQSYDHRSSRPYNAGTEHVGFSDRADIGSTKRKAPRGVGGVAWRVSCMLLRIACEADFLACGRQGRMNGLERGGLSPIPLSPAIPACQLGSGTP